MLKKNSSRSGLFLLELIISILFFSMASAVCIRLFVQAHVMDRNNRSLTQSVKLCENMAEVYTASDGDLDTLMAVYPCLRRDIRSTIRIAPWNDLASWYLLEQATVTRLLPSSQMPSDASAETESSNAYVRPSESDKKDEQEAGKDTDAPSPALSGYAVQDMLMFLDRDFHPCIIPQSGGYVLCVISFELSPSAGTLKNASFGVWEYDTMKQIEVVNELTSLTGLVDDDYFDRLSRLSVEDAVYLLDITIYVPAKGGTGE